MLLFVDYIAAKHIIAPALNTLVGGPSKVFEASRAQVKGSDRRTGAARNQERRHAERSRSIRSTAGSHRCLQRGNQPRLAAKAPGDPWISLSSVRGQRNSPGRNHLL